jgi:murein DD-endopeptidase MepM/ murein hydrolase activator NlpD
MPDGTYRLSAQARLRVWAAPTMLVVRDFVRDCAEDIPLLTRIASHVGLLLLTLLTIAASNLQFGAGARRENGNSSADANPFLSNDIADENALLLPAPIPITNLPKRVRREVVRYAVQPGDTVSDIADQHGVSADSILWANPKLEDNPDMLSLGQVLNIPPTSGVLYMVANGDTLVKIADKFKSKQVPAAQLARNILDLEFNQELHSLKEADPVLTPGQFLMVPDGYKPYAPRAVYTFVGTAPSGAAKGTGNFGWPVTGSITQRYGGRHGGIDVGAAKGTPVYAADAGYVSIAGWDREPVSYGNEVVLNHGNGYSTRYGHLSAIMVDAGESVRKGQLIGRVGSTGNSTGPHLHFEIIRNGVRRNPYSLLR